MGNVRHRSSGSTAVASDFRCRIEQHLIRTKALDGAESPLPTPTLARAERKKRRWPAPVRITVEKYGSQRRFPRSDSSRDFIPSQRNDRLNAPCTLPDVTPRIRCCSWPAALGQAAVRAWCKAASSSTDSSSARASGFSLRTSKAP